jgi:hypothetical protein
MRASTKSVTGLPSSVTLTSLPLRASRVTVVVAVPLTVTSASARVSVWPLSSIPASTAYCPSGTLNDFPELPWYLICCPVFHAMICDDRATPVRPRVVTSSLPVAALAGSAWAATISGATSSALEAMTKNLDARRIA